MTDLRREHQEERVRIFIRFAAIGITIGLGPTPTPTAAKLIGICLVAVGLVLGAVMPRTPADDEQRRTQRQDQRDVFIILSSIGLWITLGPLATTRVFVAAGIVVLAYVVSRLIPARGDS